MATGVLDAPRAEVGFQLTFFRTPAGGAEQLESPLAARQILFAHAAVSRAGDRLRHAERARHVPDWVPDTPAATARCMSAPGKCGARAKMLLSASGCGPRTARLDSHT